MNGHNIEPQVGMNVLCSHSEQNRPEGIIGEREEKKKKQTNKKILLPCICIELWSVKQTKPQNQTKTHALLSSHLIMKQKQNPEALVR